MGGASAMRSAPERETERAPHSTTQRSVTCSDGSMASCPCCGEPISSIAIAEVDHATPLARGGKHYASNFILTHRQCNKEKHNKTLREHWEWRVKVGLDQRELRAAIGG